jgi:hypothetical protein
MKREEDEQLWDLLGRAAEHKLSPFFARNVLREIRQEPKAADTGRAWLGWRRLVPASAAIAAIVAGILALQHPTKPQQSKSDADVVAKIDPQDYEVVADLDDLLAAEDDGLWDDSNSNSTL